ncbi:hypothetical protein ACFL21_04535 [Patescibacteria group bacterium]
MNFDKITKNYSEYIAKNYEERLHAGELLAESARELIKMDMKNLDLDSKLQRNFFMRKIAGDLIRQAENMGHTKRYDIDPIVKDYTYLAFDLAYNYCESKPSRNLIPFLTRVIYYERFNDNKDYSKKLKKIYKKCVELEKEYLDKMINDENSIFRGDIWGF